MERDQDTEAADSPSAALLERLDAESPWDGVEELWELPVFTEVRKP